MISAVDDGVGLITETWRIDDWQTHVISLPANGKLIHLRLHLPRGDSQVRKLEFKNTQGNVVLMLKP